MTLRSKTKRRLAILAILFVLCIGAFVGLFMFLANQWNVEAREQRDAGLAAFAAGQYAEAITHLRVYMPRHAEDVEALYAYAASRFRVPDVLGRDLYEARDLYTRLLGLEANHERAQRDLLLIAPRLELRADRHSAQLQSTIELAGRLLGIAPGSAADEAFVEQLKAVGPDDADVLHAWAMADRTLRRLDRARVIFDRIVEVAPSRTYDQIVRLEVIRDLSGDSEGREPAAPAEIEPFVKGLPYVAPAVSWAEAEPGDPARHLVLGYAYMLAARRNATSPLAAMIRAQAVSLAAAEIDLAGDATFDHPDAARLFLMRSYEAALAPRGFQVLSRHADAGRFPLNHLLYVEILFQNGRMDDVRRELSQMEPVAVRFPARLLAFKALSLLTGPEPDIEQARTYIAALNDVREIRDRGDGNSATAWAAALNLAIDHRDRQPDAALIAAYQSALTTDPDNPYIRSMLADSYAKLSEDFKAIEEWLRAVEDAGTWPGPLLRAAEVSHQRRQYQQSASLATLASARAIDPQVSLRAQALSLDAALEFAIESKGSDRFNADRYAQDLERIIDRLAIVQKAVPGEPGTLPTYVRALVEAGRTEEAKIAIDAALERYGSLGQEGLAQFRAVLLRVADISRAGGLGREGAILSLIESKSGEATADIAFARAAEMHTRGLTAEGLESLRAEAAKHPDDAMWRIAFLRYRDMTSDETTRDQTRAEWIALADDKRYESNVRVQRFSIEAPSVQTEREFLRRSIDRLRAITGDQGAAWKRARAQWIIGEISTTDPRVDEQARRLALEARDLLVQVMAQEPNTGARRLLALVYQRLGDLAAAARTLEEHLAARPDEENHQVRIALARIRIAQGAANVGAAVDLLLPLAADEGAPFDQRLEAMALLDELGRTDRAVELLESVNWPDSVRPRAELELAKIYARQGRVQEADALYAKVWKASPSPIVLQRYADFLARYGNAERLDEALALFDRYPLAPAVVALFKAETARTHKTPEEAIAFYRAAIEATHAAGAENTVPAAQRVIPHYRFIQYLFSVDRPEEAASAIADAAARLPDDPSLRLMNENREAIARAASNPVGSSLAQAMGEDALATGMIVRMLVQLSDVVVMDRDPGADPVRAAAAANAFADAMRGEADQNPRLLALHTSLADLLSLLGRTEESLSVARRAMVEFPNQVEPARQAYLAQARTGNWREALPAAQQWRARAAAEPFMADLAVAEANVGVGDARAALSFFTDPIVNRALEAPDRSSGTISIYTRALALNGLANNRPQDLEKAENILKPMLSERDVWRSIWLNVAAGVILQRDRDLTVSWLDRLEPMIPADAIGERLTFVNAWKGLYGRYRVPADVERAVELANRLLPGAEQSLADAEAAADSRRVFQARVALASIHDTLGELRVASGDLRTAYDDYGLALTKDGSLHRAANNRAMIGVEYKLDLDVALADIQRALAIQGTNPDYLDTLALVHKARNEAAEAAEAWLRGAQYEDEPAKKAVWLLNAAECFLATTAPDRTERALQTVNEIGNVIDERRLPREVQDRIVKVREAIAGAVRG